MRKIKANELVLKRGKGIEFNWELYNELPEYRQKKLLKGWMDWYKYSIYEAEKNIGYVLFNEEDYEEFGEEFGGMPEDMMKDRLNDFMSYVEPFSELVLQVSYYDMSWFIIPNPEPKNYLGGLFNMKNWCAFESDEEV